jgi:hypothetical protein
LRLEKGFFYSFNVLANRRAAVRRGVRVERRVRPGPWRRFRTLYFLKESECFLKFAFVVVVVALSLGEKSIADQ